MIDASTLLPSEPICTFIDDSGSQIDIAANRLRLFCKAVSLSVFLIPIDHSFAQTFVTQNVISLSRVDQLRNHFTYELPDPIIFCITDPLERAGMLVDGHHRYFLASQHRHKMIRAHVLPESIWLPFRISGCKPLTKQELRDIPITHRPLD